MTAAPGAEEDWMSCHMPEPRMSSALAGNRPSTLIVAGMDVNHVGGSMFAVSRAGLAPVIALAAPPALFQLTMPLRPSPLRVAAASPETRPPVVRNPAPLAPVPTYPPPAWKKAASRCRATGSPGQPP